MKDQLEQVGKIVNGDYQNQQAVTRKEPQEDVGGGRGRGRGRDGDEEGMAVAEEVVVVEARDMRKEEEDGRRKPFE